MRSDFVRTTACVMLLTVIAASVFAFTVELRRPWFGTVGKTMTAQFGLNILFLARNWYRAGIVHERAGMFTDPPSIEFPTQDSRTVYTSYPPGAVLPLYIISRIARQEPTLGMVQAYNLSNHLIIALILSLTVFALLRQLQYRHGSALAWSVIPVGLYLLLPDPLYHHQMRYFTDQPVLIWFALYVFLEVLRDSGLTTRQRRALAVAQSTVAFLGILTDWLFAIVALCTYAKRFLRGEMGRGFAGFLKQSTVFWLPIGLALGLFAVQLFMLAGWENLADKFRLWTSAPHQQAFTFGLGSYFWRFHMVHAYGFIGVALVAASSLALTLGLGGAAWRRLRRKPESPGAARVVAAMTLWLLPCLLHTIVLRNHAAFPLHSFASLKFALPIATIPFVLAPVLARAWLRSDPRSGGHAGILFPCAMILLAGVYVGIESPRVRPLFEKGIENLPVVPAARFVGDNTGYEDVVFTVEQDFEVKSGSPFLGFSMKPVHVVASLQMVYDVIAHLDGGYVVNYLVSQTAGPTGSNIDQLATRAFDCRDAAGFRLYKVRKDEVLKLCAEAHVTPPAAAPNSVRQRLWQGSNDLIQKLGDLGIDIDDLNAADAAALPK